MPLMRCDQFFFYCCYAVAKVLSCY